MKLLTGTAMKQSQDAAKKESTTLTEEELATLPEDKKQEVTQFQEEEQQNQEKVIFERTYCYGAKLIWLHWMIAIFIRKECAINLQKIC